MCRQRVTPTEPCHLLDDNLLHLAVSSANDVQTLLQLADLNAVNGEELCVGSLSVDAVNAVGNVLNHESSVVDATTVVEDIVARNNATTSVYTVPVYLEADAVCTLLYRSCERRQRVNVAVVAYCLALRVETG